MALLFKEGVGRLGRRWLRGIFGGVDADVGSLLLTLEIGVSRSLVESADLYSSPSPNQFFYRPPVFGCVYQVRVRKVDESRNYFDLAPIFAIQTGRCRVCCPMVESKI